jgi:hypothetical protein
VTALRARIARVWESLFPAPLDLGLPERVPAAEVLAIASRAADREQRACRSCGFLPRDPEERVVGKCVPGYHELGLVGCLTPQERDCQSDSWDAHVDSALRVANEWLSDEDLLGLTAHMDLAPSRPHEGTAAERGAA